jgi:Raf kinase inhibitor-like YbhB/YbcL family protein
MSPLVDRTPLRLIFALFLSISLLLLSPRRANARGPAMNLELQTNAFTPGSEIPKRFTCSGSDDSPSLSWTSVPNGSRSLALIVDDPDAPSGTFDHWIVYAIPPQSNGLSEGIPKTEELPNGSRQGRNSFGRIGYGGPCPPPGHPHHYRFRLYALDIEVTLPPGANRTQLERVMTDHVLAQAELVGTYRR